MTRDGDAAGEMPSTITAALSGDDVRGRAAGDARGAGPGDVPAIARYRITRTLGQGGMGVVFAARDPELDREVAIKLVRADVGERGDHERLVREARALARLDHPNVVRVHDAGVADGRVFVVMELVRGESLGAWMRRAPRGWREVVRRFVAAGRGLEAAHRAGLVHRDFKPDNVLCAEGDGRVCVGDFGLAVAADRWAPPAAAPAESAAGVTATVSGDGDTVVAPTTWRDAPAGAPRAAPRDRDALTATGAAVGTPAYMAPEQHHGGPVDARADVFGFCVALYEGVYGVRPFASPARGDAGGWPAAVAAGVAPAPRGRRVPAALRRALIRGLAADADARWPSMTALLAALTGVLARRRRILLGVGAAGVAGAIAAAIALGGRGPVEDACARDAGAAAARWTPAAAARVRAAVIALRPEGTTMATSVTSSFDRWAGAWRDQRDGGCRAARAGTIAAAEWAGRARCLDHLLDLLDQRVATLTARPGPAPWHIDELASLPAPSTCASGEHVDAPATAAARAEVDAVRAALDRIELDHVQGHLVTALRDARALLPRARATGWRPIVDAVALEVIDLAVIEGDDLADAERLAREVAEQAAGRGDDVAVAAAWRAVLDAKSSRRPIDGLDDVIASARGAVARLRSPRDELLLARSIGEAYLAAGRVDDARRVCRDALAAAPPAAGAPRIGLYACLAEVESDAGDFRASLAAQERYLAGQLELGGPRSPFVIDALANVAADFDHVGRPIDSLALRLTAHDALLALEPPTSVSVAQSWADLAATYVAVRRPGDDARARDAIDRAVAIVDALPPDDARRQHVHSLRGWLLGVLGDRAGEIAELTQLEATLAGAAPASSERVVVAINLADALTQAGRCADAAPMLARVSDATAGTLPPDMGVYLASARATCALAAHHPADAARVLAPAWAAIDPGALPPADRAAIALNLARALDESGGDRARARDLATRARADLGDAGDPALRREAERLLAALPRR